MKRLIFLLCLLSSILIAQKTDSLGTKLGLDASAKTSGTLAPSITRYNPSLFTNINSDNRLFIGAKIEFTFKGDSVRIKYDKSTIDQDGVFFLNYLTTVLKADTITTLNNQITELKNKLNKSYYPPKLGNSLIKGYETEPSTLYTTPFKAPYTDNQLQFFTSTPDKLSIYPDLQLPALLDNAEVFRDIPSTEFQLLCDANRFVTYKSVSLKLNQRKEVILRYSQDIRVLIEAGKNYKITNRQQYTNGGKYVSLYYIIEEL